MYIHMLFVYLYMYLLYVCMCVYVYIYIYMGAAQESGDVDALWEQMQASRVRPDAVRTVMI